MASKWTEGCIGKYFFSKLGKKPSRLSLGQINVSEKFVLEIYAIRKVDSLTQARIDKFMMSRDNDLFKTST